MFRSLLCSAAAVASVLGTQVTLQIQDGVYTFQNGFVNVELSASGGAWVSSLRGDFEGSGLYGNNLLSESGLRLEKISSSGSVVSAAGRGPPAEVNVVRNDGSCLELSLPAVYDDVESPSVVETWAISLCEGDRAFSFSSKGQVLDSAVGTSVLAVVHSLYAASLSTYGI
jgi:hypothetical protein